MNKLEDKELIISQVKNNPVDEHLEESSHLSPDEMNELNDNPSLQDKEEVDARLTNDLIITGVSEDRPRISHKKLTDDEIKKGLTLEEIAIK